MSEKKQREEMTRQYLEPFPEKSFVRRQIVWLFHGSGLPYVAAEIYAALILRGGTAYPDMIASDIGLSIERIESANGLEALLEKKLVGITHHRPRLLLVLDDFDDIENMVVGSKRRDGFVKAREMLSRLGNYNYQKNSHGLDHEYLEHVKALSRSFSQLFYLIDYPCSRLLLEKNASAFLALLCQAGGSVQKREFFKNKVKRFKEIPFPEEKPLRDDLALLGYHGEALDSLLSEILIYYSTPQRLALGHEHTLNAIIESTNDIISFYKGGKKASTDLIMTLEDTGECLFKRTGIVIEQGKKLFQHLRMAYNNVKIDENLYHSNLSSHDAFIKRFERELDFAKEISASYYYENMLNVTLRRLLEWSVIPDHELELFAMGSLKNSFISIIGDHASESNTDVGNYSGEIVFIPYSAFTGTGNIFLFIYDIDKGTMLVGNKLHVDKPAVFSRYPGMIEQRMDHFKQLRTIQDVEKMTIQDLLNKSNQIKGE